MSTLNGKHIIFIVGSLELGGSEWQAFHLARYLMTVEHARVSFLGFSGPGKLSQLCDQYEIPWQIVPNPIAGIMFERKIRLLHFVRTMRKNHPDILLPYTTTPNVVCGLTWRWTGAKLCVWNQRDLGIERLAPGLEKKAVKHIPLFVSNSKHGADFLEQTFHIPSKKVRVIRNGVELLAPQKSGQEWRTSLGADEKTFLACMVANVSKHKDHATLLKAWRKVVDHLTSAGSQCMLILAGRFDGTEIHLKALASELDLDNHILFLGGVDDIVGLLRAVDLGVFSSKSEGSPNGVLECMAAGLADVGTDIPGIREILPPEQAAHLAAVEDSDGLARIITELAINPALRDKLGSRNRDRVAEEFNVERMCQETAALLGAWSRK
jgi:glycosyltransferase involved in cell wall biosynthesis